MGQVPGKFVTFWPQSYIILFCTNAASFALPCRPEFDETVDSIQFQQMAAWIWMHILGWPSLSSSTSDPLNGELNLMSQFCAGFH